MENIAWIGVLIYFIIVLVHGFSKMVSEKQEEVKILSKEGPTTYMRLVETRYGVIDMRSEFIMDEMMLLHCDPKTEEHIKEAELRKFGYKVAKQFAEWEEKDFQTAWYEGDHSVQHGQKKFKIRMSVVDFKNPK